MSHMLVEWKDKFLKQKYTVMLSANVFHHDTDSSGVIQLIVPENEFERKPVQIIATVDVSGSMNTPAVCKGEKGEDLNKGWSNMDINIHGLLTLIEMSNDEDMLSIITFSDNANIVMDWKNMNAEGKKIACLIVRGIKVGGMTNLSDAIDKTGSLMCSSRLQHSVSYCILFTDGAPTVEVKRSQKFKEQLDKQISWASTEKNVNYSIVSIAIGNSIDSELLKMISNVYHVPYTQFLCPFMVNLMARIVTSYQFPNSNYHSHSLSTTDDIVFLNSENDGKEVNLGTLVHGINRHIPFIGESAKHIYVNGTLVNVKNTYKNSLLVNKEIYRVMVARAIESKNTAELKSLIVQCTDPDVCETAREVLLGIESHYNSWGRHYPCAISKALMNELRTNFLDKSIQKYTSKTFESICDYGEEQFSKVKPPTPSLINELSNGFNTTPTQTPVALPDEFLRGGGCLANPKQKLFCKKGDGFSFITIEEILLQEDICSVELFTKHGLSPIECLIKVKTSPNTVVKDVKGCLLTEWHPIRINNSKWMFPNEKKFESVKTPNYVYNFVMKNRANLLILNGEINIEYATLGHFATTKLMDNVSYHEYWATERCINYLKTNVSYMNGFVIIPENKNLSAPKLMKTTTSNIIKV